jgi:hypothetical protein
VGIETPIKKFSTKVEELSPERAKKLKADKLIIVERSRRQK